MSTRDLFALIVVFSSVGQVGCVCMGNLGCGSGGCGMGGQVYGGPSCGVADASCGVADASCGVADASCGCPDASCGCPDASCGCPDGCGGGVRCGASVRQNAACPLLSRLRNAICGCSGCGGQAYWNEWQADPPCDCDACDSYGNHTGGPYNSPHGRRARLAKKNFAEELRFSQAESRNVYR